VILGISADSVKALANFKTKRKLNFPLLSDPDHKTIQAYNSWRMKKFMGRSSMGIVRSTFLIDPGGKVDKIWDQVSPKGHAAEVLSHLTVSRVMRSELHS
jgi:thioredoxin-dependent peroxiredoxin